MQVMLVIILQYGISDFVRNPDSSESLTKSTATMFFFFGDDDTVLPVWMLSVANIVFLYYSFRTGFPPCFAALYCYWEMETQQLFAKHKNPKRTRLFAIWFVGWEMFIFVGIMLSGNNMIALSQNPLELILNVVALHFIYDIDVN